MNSITKAFSLVQINFRTMALVLSLVIYMLHIGKGQFQGMDEEMMKKMGELYGFPVEQGQGQQIPGQGLPGTNGQPGQRSERQGQGGVPPNQGQWNPGQSQPWPNQDSDWPDAKQGQGQPWPNQGQGQGQPWPNQGQQPPNQGQQPAGGGLPNQAGTDPGSPQDQQPKTGQSQPKGSGGSAVNTGPLDPKQPDTNYDMDHGGRTDDKHHKHGSVDELHPRAPKPKHDYLVKLFNGTIHSRFVHFIAVCRRFLLNKSWKRKVFFFLQKRDLMSCKLV